MKQALIYFTILFLSTGTLYFFKKNITKNNIENIKLSNYKYTNPIAEIEILNGCGIDGIAEIFTNYLRLINYDVISIENAKNKLGEKKFDHENSKIIIYKKNKLKAGYELSLKLGINKNNIIKQYNEKIWDLGLIIGKDYKKINSFKQINNSHDIF